MKEIVEKILAEIETLQTEIQKEDNKSAAARARKSTLALAKLGKEYRKLSIAESKK